MRPSVGVRGVPCLGVDGDWLRRDHPGREMVDGGMAGWPGGIVDLTEWLTLRGEEGGWSS